MIARTLTLAALLIASPALSQTVVWPTCGLAKAAYAELAGKYGESRILVLADAPDAIVEIWVSASGSWSLLVTKPDGTTCLYADGDGWEALPLPEAGEPA